jgi:PAS domain S-box-containing protein
MRSIMKSGATPPALERPDEADRATASIPGLRPSWSVMRPTQAGAGLAASALGFTVVAAWLLRNEALTRVHPLFAPMPYSVAIGLAIGGVALLAGAIGRQRLARLAASIVLALGLATLAQHALGTGWNLHRALLAGLIEGVPPGMTPSTALSFVLVGVGLLAVSLHPGRGSVVCAISGTAVAAQNAVAFAWYGFGLASWHVVTGTAPHVAIGLTASGLGTIAAAWDRRKRRFGGPPRWLPLPVAVGIALISLSLWHQSESDRVATIEETTQLRAERLGNDIKRLTGPLTGALLRLAEAEAASRGGPVDIEPQALSALDLERFPGLFAIAFVDRESGLRWMQTRTSASPSLSDLQVPEQACDVLLRRPVGGSPTVIDRSALRAGGSGFVLAVPVRNSGRLAGVVVGLFRYDDFFLAALGEDVSADYWLRVSDGQRELYRHEGATPRNDAYAAAALIPFLDTKWRAQIWPRVISGPRRPLADWTLVFGLVFAGLLGWTVHMAQRSARSQNLLAHAKADLRSAIIARQAAQAARDESEVRYKQIIDAAADIIYRTDDKGRFIFVNPAAIRVTKWSREDLIGRNYLTLIRPDRRAAAREFYETQAAKRIPSTYYDFPIVTADGQEVWIGQHVQLLIEGIRIVGFQAVARDINHRIRIQDELQRTCDAALETVRMKSAFVANTSHEIRTPLNGIIGFSNLLLETDLSSEQRTCAEGLRVSADALLAIIDDVLDFSKIEAGMLRLEIVSFDMRAVVNDVIMLVGDAARRKQLTLNAAVDERLPRYVKGDPNRLRQVLNNLLANAIKFTERGSVAIRVEPESAGVVRFSITDTGIGIEPHAQRSLFQPFVQADVSTSRRFGGTGLGLAISREIVELMGGSIHVASAPGSGSTFWFTVKLEASESLLLSPHPASEPEGVGPSVERPTDGSRILVVDDNPVSQQVTKLLLEKLGCTVETAANGLEAVRAATSAAFALVLMDCQMPVMDGFSAAAAIRRAEPGTQHTPIIAFTASARSGERERCLLAGMDDLLEKPVRKQDLVDLLERWTRSPQSTPSPERVSDAIHVPSSELVDIDILDNLSSHVGDEALNQLIELHLEELEAAIQRMNQLTGNGNTANLRSEAHRLKGGSLTLGLKQLGGLCAKLEDDADRFTEFERRDCVRLLRTVSARLHEWQRRRTA